MTIDQGLQLGIEHHQAGRLMEAEQCYRRVLQHAPGHPDALHLLGMLARRAGKLEAAADLIGRAVAIHPLRAEFHGNLGLVFTDQNQLDQAISCYRRAIELKPDFAAAHCNLGFALERLGQLDHAVDAYQSAVRIDPRFFQAHSNLGNALAKQKKFDAAISSLTTARNLNPFSDDVDYNLGRVLRESGRLDEAVAAFSRAIKTNPHNLTARCDLGNVLRDRGERQLAIEEYEKAIAVDPNCAVAHWNLSLTCLLMGDFQRGWAEHEWRTQCDSLARPEEFDKPRWQGEMLNGRTILLHPEQGFGDLLQFVRYAQLVSSQDGTVLVQCQPELLRLLKNLRGVSQVLPLGQPLPDFDLHCPLMSLPFVFGTRLDSIPMSVPYLFADPSLIDIWKNKIGTGGAMRVGLAWAGSSTHKNDRNRSLPLSELAPLGAIEGVQFFSLQIGSGQEQISTTKFGRRLVNHTSSLHDFADTAALIANLDLVISVDTSVAHLAGGMGRPVWVLLPHDPDWRWLLDRDDSPWYPTMRLFRQSSRGDWTSVVGDVVQSVRFMVK